MGRYLRWKETPDGQGLKRQENYMAMLDNWDSHCNEDGREKCQYRYVELRVNRFADLCGIDREVVMKYLTSDNTTSYYNLAKRLYDDGYLKDEYIKFGEE